MKFFSKDKKLIIVLLITRRQLKKNYISLVKCLNVKTILENNMYFDEFFKS